MSMSDNRHDSSDERDSLINDLRISLNKSIKESIVVSDSCKKIIKTVYQEDFNLFYPDLLIP